MRKNPLEQSKQHLSISSSDTAMAIDCPGVMDFPYQRETIFDFSFSDKSWVDILLRAVVLPIEINVLLLMITDI